jgi:hypothetical protein
MCIDQSIDQFCDHFKDQFKVIAAIAVDQQRARGTDLETHQVRFYKKVLLITQVDTLAGVRYSKERYPQLNKRNQDRFITFLREHDIWPEGELVSMPFLKEAIGTGKISNGKLKDVVESKNAQSFEEGAFNIDFSSIDLKSHELLQLCTTEQEEKVVRENTHYELLYRYRNYLVHEARVPGNAMEVTDDSRPYYHGYIGQDRLFLAYPLGHFLDLAEKSIAVIERYLRDNRFNPYDFVSETTRW